MWAASVRGSGPTATTAPGHSPLARAAESEMIELADLQVQSSTWMIELADLQVQWVIELTDL